MNRKKDSLSLLFVCLGNICRSPAAEAVMRKKLSERTLCANRFVVDSAGIGSWHVGQLPDHRMRRVGERHGYRIDSIARQVCTADFERFDYIIGMDEENLRDLNRLAPNAAAKSKIICAADFLSHHPNYKTVPDPYYGTERDFEIALELIEDACDGIISKLCL